MHAIAVTGTAIITSQPCTVTGVDVWIDNATILTVSHGIVMMLLICICTPFIANAGIPRITTISSYSGSHGIVEHSITTNTTVTVQAIASTAGKRTRSSAITHVNIWIHNNAAILTASHGCNHAIVFIQRHHHHSIMFIIIICSMSTVIDSFILAFNNGTEITIK